MPPAIPRASPRPWPPPRQPAGRRCTVPGAGAPPAALAPRPRWGPRARARWGPARAPRRATRSRGCAPGRGRGRRWVPPAAAVGAHAAARPRWVHRVWGRRRHCGGASPRAAPRRCCQRGFAARGPLPRATAREASLHARTPQPPPRAPFCPQPHPGPSRRWAPARSPPPGSPGTAPRAPGAPNNPPIACGGAAPGERLLSAICSRGTARPALPRPPHRPRAASRPLRLAYAPAPGARRTHARGAPPPATARAPRAAGLQLRAPRPAPRASRSGLRAALRGDSRRRDGQRPVHLPAAGVRRRHRVLWQVLPDRRERCAPAAAAGGRGGGMGRAGGAAGAGGGLAAARRPGLASAAAPTPECPSTPPLPPPKVATASTPSAARASRACCRCVSSSWTCSVRGRAGAGGAAADRGAVRSCCGGAVSWTLLAAPPPTCRRDQDPGQRVCHAGGQRAIPGGQGGRALQGPRRAPLSAAASWQT
jgi:hypothetical protein